jgi:serine/threonine protein kinase
MVGSGGRRTRLCPQRGRDSPRHQAVQLAPLPGRPAERQRLRPGPPARTAGDDDDRRVRRDAHVPVTRADHSRPAPLDRRTDIYSLGATLYELLTLQPPFAAERRDQVIAQIMHKEPRPPRTVNPDRVKEGSAEHQGSHHSSLLTFIMLPSVNVTPTFLFAGPSGL